MRTVTVAARVERPEPGEVILSDAAGVVHVRIGEHGRYSLGNGNLDASGGRSYAWRPEVDLAALGLALADGQATVEAGTRTPTQQGGM